MAAPKKEKDREVINIVSVSHAEATFCVLGTEPLICNRVSENAKRELLLPKGTKTAAEKASTLKHNPLEEFHASAHRSPDPNAPTLIVHPSTAFKGALRSAALDLDGSSKAQIGRLTYIPGQWVSIYGVPKLLMSIVRQADPKRTPDVRTRVIIPEWAAWVTVRYVTPLLREQVIANLFAGAGIISGTGDWRAEKGSGNYGSFEPILADNEDFVRITTTMGRAAQLEAMEKAEPHDYDSADLLEWYQTEVRRRGFTMVDGQLIAPPPVEKKKRPPKAIPGDEAILGRLS